MPKAGCALSLLLALACAHQPRARAPSLAVLPFDAETLGGETLTVGGPGPVRLVELWATWCPPCGPASGIAGRVLSRHPRVRAYAVSLDEDREALAHRLSSSPPPGIPLVFRGGSPTARQAGLDQLPTFLVLDERGRLVGRLVGLFPGLGPRLDRLLRNAEGAVGEPR